MSQLTVQAGLLPGYASAKGGEWPGVPRRGWGLEMLPRLQSGQTSRRGCQRLKTGGEAGLCLSCGVFLPLLHLDTLNSPFHFLPWFGPWAHPQVRGQSLRWSPVSLLAWTPRFWGWFSASLPTLA